jgi:hypothetical protein
VRGEGRHSLNGHALQDAIGDQAAVKYHARANIADGVCEPVPIKRRALLSPHPSKGLGCKGLPQAQSHVRS